MENKIAEKYPEGNKREEVFLKFRRELPQVCF